MEMICSYLPAAERKVAWEAVHGQIPEGMRLGQTCLVDYCWKIEHMALVRNLNFGHSNYRQYRDRISALEPGEYFEIPDVPANERDLTKFRCGLINAAGLHRIRMRSMPNGGVRIYKWGQWGSISNGLEEWDLPGSPLLLNKTQQWVKQQRTSSFYLGFMDWEPSDQPISSVPRCDAKGCPFPRVFNKLCRHHHGFFAFPISMTDTAIDRSRISFSYEGGESGREHQLYAEFLIKTDSLEKSLRFERNGRFETAHKNAGPIDLPAPVLPRYKQYKNPSRTRVRSVEARTDFVPENERVNDGEVYAELEVKDGLLMTGVTDELSSVFENGVYED